MTYYIYILNIIHQYIAFDDNFGVDSDLILVQLKTTSYRHKYKICLNMSTYIQQG